MCSSSQRDSGTLGIISSENVVTNGVLRRLTSAFHALEECGSSVGVIHDADALVETRITTIEGDVVVVHDPNLSLLT